VLTSRILYDSVPGLGNNPFPSELGVFLTASVIVVVALILAAGRGAEDPEHHLPVARYLGAVVVLTFFVALFAGFSTVYSLTDLMVNHTDRSAEWRREQRQSDFASGTTQVNLPVAETQFDFSAERNNDANYSAAVASGLVALTAAGVCAGHLRARRRIDRDAPAVRSVGRVARLGVCFVTALTAAVAVTSVGFAIFEIAAPGIAIGGNANVGRAEGISEALSFGVLAIAALLVFRSSWRRARPPRPEPAPEPPESPAPPDIEPTAPAVSAP
jgi:hypothetical protein